MTENQDPKDSLPDNTPKHAGDASLKGGADNPDAAATDAAATDAAATDAAADTAASDAVATDAAAPATRAAVIRRNVRSILYAPLG